MTEEEYFRKNYPDSCYGDRLLSPYWDFFQDGVEFGERQSEKKIEELEQENKELKSELTKKADTNHSLVEQMAKLEEENAELKEHIKADCIDCADYIKNQKLEKENHLLGERCNQLLKDKGELTDKIADLKANCDLAIEGRDVKIKEIELELTVEKDQHQEEINLHLHAEDYIKSLEKENAELKKKLEYWKSEYEKLFNEQ